MWRHVGVEATLIVARCYSPYPFCRTVLTSEPIRPQFGSEFPTLDSPRRNNPGTIRVPLRSCVWFYIPVNPRKSLTFHIKLLCHGTDHREDSVVDETLPACDILSLPKTSLENQTSRFPIVDGKTSIW